jgi:hypothetical protein
MKIKILRYLWKKSSKLNRYIGKLLIKEYNLNNVRNNK